MTTKMVVTVLGLAALVATPALAQKPTHRAHAADAYASVAQPMAPLGAGGNAVGTDPDANIRFELNRDATTYSTGN